MFHYFVDIIYMFGPQEYFSKIFHRQPNVIILSQFDK